MVWDRAQVLNAASEQNNSWLRLVLLGLNVGFWVSKADLCCCQNSFSKWCYVYLPGCYSLLLYSNITEGKVAPLCTWHLGFFFFLLLSLVFVAYKLTSDIWFILLFFLNSFLIVFQDRPQYLQHPWSWPKFCKFIKFVFYLNRYFMGVF